MLVLVLAVVSGAIALRLRQPLILAFIVSGILVGPSGFNIVTTTDQFALLAQLGIALLLFVVGLKLDLTQMRSIGSVALATGFGQVAFTLVFGYPLARLLGFEPVAAIYIAAALTFSSTIIIVKLLSDKGETESLHGRVAIGLGIVQSIIVILLMIALSAFVGNDDRIELQVIMLIGRGVLLIAGLFFISTYVLPRLLDKLSRNAEVLVLFAITWAVGIAALSEIMGLSKEVGAFLAGVSLASTAFREVIGARLVSMRDFLLLFFFIDLGLRIDLFALGSDSWKAIPLSALVLIGNPFSVILVMWVMGYKRRTSFLAGLTVAQISEFSLILVALGLRLGHITADTVGMMALVAMITFTVCTYMIIYSHQLYEMLSNPLRIFERKTALREQFMDGGRVYGPQAEVIMFGCGRYGSSIAGSLIENGRHVLGVDFDPQAVKAWNERGWSARFGDAEDPEYPASLPLSEAKWVISTVPDRNVSVCLIDAVQNHGYKECIAVSARDSEDLAPLKDAGADLIFLPFSDSAAYAVETLARADEQTRRRRMDKQIAGLSNHYIVCGYGRMGQQIVKDFQHDEVPHVVVESNTVQIPRLVEDNVPFVEGNASEDKVLTAAGIKRAKGLIAVTATDEENVFIVLTARGINPDLYIVARSILEENEDKLKRAGANVVMSPYTLGGHRIAAAVLKPRAMDFLDLLVHSNHLDMEIGDLTVKAASPFAGKSLEESGIREASGVLILAIKRKAGETIPNPDSRSVVEVGDELVVMGTSAQLDAAENLTSRE